MNTFLVKSTFFGATLSLCAYFLGLWLKKKTNIKALNPLAVAIIITILVLVVFNIDYDVYNSSAKYLSYLLTPATVALAIPLYQQFELLKKNVKAIMLGITSGVIASLTSILLLSKLFGLSFQEYVTFLPKSITTAIGMSVSQQLGGYVSITVAIIVITGIFGNIVAEAVLKLFHIKNPIAKGIGIGTAAHAIGTSKAMEIGEVEGAMSSLSIVISGVLTVLLASLFAMLY